ncbi:uncharacterized protein LOC129738080 [Uranotaenia lowii]|uniref:uncharacterized protein LOC129738080 n=1 Tax=Uranotaenia lowii TaxID=190385 RepID=UPI00247991EB|nr:uncharacterized protein LOC129738080 [Uranotaenia lowii]
MFWWTIVVCSLGTLVWVESQLVGTIEDPTETISCRLRLQLIDHYFSDCHNVNIIVNECAFEFFFEEADCAIQSHPVYIISKNRFQRQLNAKRQEVVSNIQEVVSGFSSVEAFVAWGTAETFTEEIMPNLVHRNLQSKIVLIGYRLPKGKIAYIFHHAWNWYKLLNVVVINVIGDDKIKICTFEPFGTQERQADSVQLEDLRCVSLRSLEEMEVYLLEFDQFIEARTKQLNGHPLTVAMHESQGTTSAFDCILDSITIRDVDMHLLDIFQKKMNFTVNFIHSDLEISMGYIFPNGSLAGSLEMIQNCQVDLAANSRIIHNYNEFNVFYLNYIATDKLKFLVPSNYYAGRDKRMILINPFSIAYMMLNVILSIVIPIILLVLERMKSHILPIEDHSPLGVTVMRMIGIIYNVSVRQPVALKKRFIIFGLLVYNIVSYSLWQAVTIGYLEPGNRAVNHINTLEQLLETDLALKVTNYHHHIVIDEGSNFENPMYRNLAKRLDTKGTSLIRTALEDVIRNRNSAFLISDMYVPLVLAGSYKWHPEFKSSLNEIPEPVYEFYKSMVVPKSSPFIETFNGLISRFVESGFVVEQARQLDIVEYLLQIKRTAENEQEPYERVFDMESLKFLFVFYLIMMLLATVVFVLELLYHCYEQKKKQKRKKTVRVAFEQEYVPFEFVI